VLSGLGRIKEVPYTGPRRVDLVGALLSVIGMGGIVLGILAWQEGAESVLGVMAIGAIALGSLAWWLLRRKRNDEPALLDPDLFRLPHFRLGASQQMMQQIILGGLMIALPIFLQITLEYNAMGAGLSLAPLSLTMFAVALVAGKKAGALRPASIVRVGFVLTTIGTLLILPIVPRAESGWYLFVPLLIVGAGLGLLVSQLNNFTLAPIEEERVSEAAGVNSAAGSFGLSFGLAMAGGVMLATLSFSFTNLTESSDVIPADQQQLIADVMEEDAEVVSDTQLNAIVAEEPPAVADEILDINREARDRALQVALLVPLVAGLVGVFGGFRMVRLPDLGPAAHHDGIDFG
jgi:hypothetical protein